MKLTTSKSQIHGFNFISSSAAVKHLNRLENLLSTQTKSRNAILYTDESKLEENLGAGLCYMYKDITHQQS